jgi:transcriptional repressor NrdR
LPRQAQALPGLFVFPAFRQTFPLVFLIAICQYVDMVCTNCGGDTKVTNSRWLARNNKVWRRRQCLACTLVFTTEENTQYAVTWSVYEPSGSFTPFSRDKLFLSIYNCLQHRPTALKDAAGLTETVINRLPPHLTDMTLLRPQISQVTQVALNRFDKAASIQYQALHSSTRTTP